jgi:hypothetical protein
MGHCLTAVIQDQIQADAAFRASANLVCESGEGILLRDIESEDRNELWLGLRNVIEHWRPLWLVCTENAIRHYKRMDRL